VHGDRIERIAIVRPERWRNEALMFAGADLRKAPVEFFGEKALANARTWLSA
jgi:stage II sporulation SpoAA-like protein